MSFQLSKVLPTRVGRATTLAVFAFTLFGSGAPAYADGPNRKEGDLAAAGFIVKTADTPVQQQMLNQLPKKKLLLRTTGGNVHYVYADPRGCNCIYVGDQDAYQSYKQQRQAQGIADDAAMVAASYANPAWDWGPWGDFGPGWGGYAIGW